MTLKPSITQPRGRARDTKRSMSTENDELKEKETPAAPSAEQKNEKHDPTSGDGSGVTDKEKASEPMIPKHRFDEVAEKARVAEQALSELAELKQKFSAMGEALGGKQAQKDIIDDVKALSEKYGLKDDFVKDMLLVSTARAKREFQEELKPLKAQQAQAILTSEFTALAEEIPEAKDMSKEEREELTKMALDKRYHNVPLVELWKIKNFGRPTGKAKTAEPSRPGAPKPTDGEVDVKKMSLSEFEKYSNDLAKKK